MSKRVNILQSNQYMKSYKMSYIIYVELESLIKNIDRQPNHLKKSSITKIGEHINCTYSISTIWTFDNIENKHRVSRGKDCIKTFCSSLKEHDTNVNNFEENKMLQLTK